LLRTKRSTKIGKLLGLLLGLKRTIGLRSRQPKTGIKLLSSQVLASPKLIRLHSSLLIGQSRLKIGSLVHPLHILNIRDVEASSLKTRGLIGQRSL